MEIHPVGAESFHLGRQTDRRMRGTDTQKWWR